MHSPDSEIDDKKIKEATFLFKNFNSEFGGLVPGRVSLKDVLLEYREEIRNLNQSDHYLRIFLFTAEDNPHPNGDKDRA